MPKIVYCKDDDRRGHYSQERFDFLGYTFRPRRSKNWWGKYVVNCSPAASAEATRDFRRALRRWHLHTHSDKSLEDLSRMFNPILRGWSNYYSRFYKSALYPTFQHSFDFLGFAFRWEKSRQGKSVVKCRTSRQKFRRTMANVTEWCRAHRSLPLRRLFRALNVKLRGHYNYYGIIGNYDSLHAFFTQAMPILWTWLNRRSQKRSYTWQRFEALLKHSRIERPRITDTPQHQLALSLAFR